MLLSGCAETKENEQMENEVQKLEKDTTNEAEIHKLTSPEVKEFIKDLSPVAGVETNSQRLPLYRGCKDLTSINEQKICLYENVNHFVKSNLDKSFSENKGFSGVVRGAIFLEMSEDGEVKVKGVKANNSIFEAELERIAKQLPEMTAPAQNNKLTRVTVPVVIQMG